MAEERLGGGELLPLGELAIELKVSPAAMYQAAVRGELEITKSGGRWFCARWAAESFAAQHHAASTRTIGAGAQP